MKKIKIRIIKIGHLPIEFKSYKLLNWKSQLFEIIGNIETYDLPTNSDGNSWEYTDNNLRQSLPQNENANFTIAITNVKLENNYYSRRIAENYAVITFYEMKDILGYANIPLENILLRIIYAYTLVFLMFQKLPNMDIRSFTHDETRGCIYDMTGGDKAEVIYSCNKPKICDECKMKLKQNKISSEVLQTAEKEISKIHKELYYTMVDIFKKHPISSFLIIIILSTIISDITNHSLKLILNIFHALW
ncbi:MAG: hypothetical protein PHE78_04295 [Candidatus Gastranaerophilales bacterium]|nr:hypothetical protein [Candidatus Gastranaerophilales bacterium]